MDWLQFISSLVGSLAWPIAVLTIAIVFRKTLRTALARPLKRVKAGPFEAEWDDKVARAFVGGCVLRVSPERSEHDVPKDDAFLHLPRTLQRTSFATEWDHWSGKMLSRTP